MAQPSTAARIVHDLGLAAYFGGTLFGKVAFNPSVGLVGSRPERGKVGGKTWNRFNLLNTASFGTVAATWLPERLGLVCEEVDRRAPGLVLVKDVLLGVAALTGLAAMVVQILLNRQAPEAAVPLETGGVPAPEASDRAARLQRAVGALGSVNAALFGGLVAVTTALRQEAGKPARGGRR